MAEAANAMEDMMARLRREFLDTADDRLGTLDSLVAEVKKLNAPLEAEYLKGAAGQNTDGKAVLSFFRSQVKMLAK